jgi:hypothetical protein
MLAQWVLAAAFAPTVVSESPRLAFGQRVVLEFPSFLEKG